MAYSNTTHKRPSLHLHQWMLWRNWDVSLVTLTMATPIQTFWQCQHVLWPSPSCHADNLAFVNHGCCELAQPHRRPMCFFLVQPGLTPWSTSHDTCARWGLAGGCPQLPCHDCLSPGSCTFWGVLQLSLRDSDSILALATRCCYLANGCITFHSSCGDSNVHQSSMPGKLSTEKSL